MNIGARILKTGISAGMALYISHLLNLESGVFAAISAFIAVQPSVYRSWKYLGEQIKANILGVILALLGFIAFGNTPVVIGMVVILSLLASIKLKFSSSSIHLSSLTVVAVMAVENADFFQVAGDRFAAIAIGVACSILINILFLPPKYEDKLLHHIEKTSEQISVLLRNILQEEMEMKAYKESKVIMNDNITKANNLFDYYHEEFQHLFKRAKYSEAKKLVIYRSMISSTKKAKVLVERIEKYRRDINALPVEVQEKIKHQLHLLTLYDEKVFMKYQEKIKPTQSDSTKEEIDRNNIELKEILYSCPSYKSSLVDLDFSIVLLADVLNFCAELEKLDSLITMYRIQKR